MSTDVLFGLLYSSCCRIVQYAACSGTSLLLGRRGTAGVMYRLFRATVYAVAQTVPCTGGCRSFSSQHCWNIHGGV